MIVHESTVYNGTHMNLISLLEVYLLNFTV